MFDITVVEDWRKEGKPHYPHYRIGRTHVGVASTLENAEKLIIDVINGDSVSDIHHFNVREISQDSVFIGVECLSEYVYDKNGKLIDSRSYSNVGSNPGDFLGRTPGQIRFKPGDIVEVERYDEIYLAFVVMPPSSVEEEREYYSKWHKHMDYTDDSYTVLTDSDYGSHRHIESLSVFKPLYRIPRSFEERFRKAYRKYLDNEKRWDEAFAAAPGKFQSVADEFGLKCDIFVGWPCSIKFRDFPVAGDTTEVEFDTEAVLFNFDRVRATLHRLLGRKTEDRGYAIRKECNRRGADAHNVIFVMRKGGKRRKRRV